MFNKARQSRIFEDVIQQVEEAIIKGELKAGDRLPAERELQKMMDVSRGTLRESLRVLEQKGLVEIKTGAKGGVFIKGLNADQMSESLALFVRSQQVTLGHLAQFREDVEGLVASRAADLATRRQVEELKSLLAKAADFLARGPEYCDAFLATDKEIHLALARIAGNPIHLFFLKTVHDNLHWDNMKTYLPHDEKTLRVVYDDLEIIVNAVAGGDGEQARVMAREHVTKFNEWMEREAAAKRIDSEIERVPSEI